MNFFKKKKIKVRESVLENQMCQRLRKEMIHDLNIIERQPLCEKGRREMFSQCLMNDQISGVVPSGPDLVMYVDLMSCDIVTHAYQF